MRIHLNWISFSVLIASNTLAVLSNPKEIFSRVRCGKDMITDPYFFSNSLPGGYGGLGGYGSYGSYGNSINSKNGFKNESISLIRRFKLINSFLYFRSPPPPPS